MMLRGLAAEAAAAGLAVPEPVAIGLPARIAADGSLGDGAEALPGDWSEPGFLPGEALGRSLSAEHGTVLMHHSTVTFGMSEAPFHRDVARWGVLRIGADPGYARFTNLPLRR